MDQFVDGIHIRLRSRVRRAYLHADEDGVGVSLRALGRDREPTPTAAATLNTVWRVHRVVRDGIHYVLLHGAAYGRYLALSPDRGKEEEEVGGHEGVPAIQRGYDARDLDAVMWRPVSVAGANAGGYLRMRHVYNGNLRANGRFRFWKSRVTIDQYFGTRSTMRHWSVEVVPPRLGPPPALPVPIPTGNPGSRSGLLRRRTGPVADRRRMIRYLRSDDPRKFGEDGLPAFPFYGRSVFNLRFEVGIRANPGDVFNTVMCVKAGLCGRLTPLVTDLPPGNERMDIVVFTAGSPGAAKLVYPDVHAQGQ